MRIVWLGKYPNPVSLVIRLLRRPDPEARAALFYSALTVAASPLDLIAGIYERRLWQAADPSRHPLIFVVGPSRSGTTVVYQALVKALPVSYINNLTSIFPRSPITATRLVRRPFRNADVRLQSYYGRTANWWEPNDKLFLWERWLGGNLRVPPTDLAPDMAQEMVQFFGAWSETFGQPLLNKVNALNFSAHLVAPVLPQAYFICLTRHPVFLAQSLLQARRDINGTTNLPYGVDLPSRIRDVDPYKDVCSQVREYGAVADRQEALIGRDKFWLVSYEDFCARPSLLVERVAREALGIDFDAEAVDHVVPPIKASARQSLPDVEFNRITQEIARMGLGG